MATTLTTPESLETVTRKAITRWETQISYNADGSPDTDNIFITYYVGEFNAAGDGVNQESETIYFNNWPTVFKTDAKAVHNKVISDAKTKGLIGTGTDSDDIP